MHMQPLYQGAPYHGTGADEALFQHGLCLPSGSEGVGLLQEEVRADRLLGFFDERS